MFTAVTRLIRGVGALLILSLSTIVLTTVICILALGKFLAPTESIRDSARHALAAFLISRNGSA